MNVPFWIWCLAWIGSVVLGGVLAAELWIRLRDNYRRDGIDLDEMDRSKPPTPSEECRYCREAVERVRQAMQDAEHRRPL